MIVSGRLYKPETDIFQRWAAWAERHPYGKPMFGALDDCVLDDVLNEIAQHGSIASGIGAEQRAEEKEFAARADNRIPEDWQAERAMAAAKARAGRAKSLSTLRALRIGRKVRPSRSERVASFWSSLRAADEQRDATAEIENRTAP